MIEFIDLANGTCEEITVDTRQAVMNHSVIRVIAVSPENSNLCSTGKIHFVRTEIIYL